MLGLIIKMKIKLTFRAKDFREVYFRDEKGKVLLSNEAKGYTIICLSILIITIITSLAFLLFDLPIGFLIISTIAFILSFAYLYKRIEPKLKWKKEINMFVRKQEKIVPQSLELNELSFSLIEGQRETIEKWAEIRSAEVEADFIIINTSKYFVFPKKSMADKDFNYFSKILKEKIKTSPNNK